MLRLICRASAALLPIAIWSYVALLAIVGALIWFGGDRWWVATVLLFSPRAAFGIPLLVFLPAAIFWNGVC